MLDLRQACDLLGWFFVELDLYRARFEGLDGRRERGERLGNFVAKVQGDATEMTVIFGFEAYLHLLVLVQDALIVIDEAFKPL